MIKDFIKTTGLSTMPVYDGNDSRLTSHIFSKLILNNKREQYWITLKKQFKKKISLTTSARKFFKTIFFKTKCF